MILRTVFLLLSCCAVGSSAILASEMVDRGSVTVAAEAWRWNMAPWDSEKVLSWNDHQYTIFWDKEGYLTLARRNLNDDSVQSTRFNDARISVDNPHNSTTIGISPGDGRLHISYHQWATPLRYRRSIAGFITSPPPSIASSHFGGEEALTGRNETQVTYPRFFNLNDGELFILYRGDGGSSNSDNFLNRYNAQTGQWERIGMLFSRAGSYSGPGYSTSTARNAYLNDVVVDRNDRIHITWTYREGSGHATNHDLHYITSDDRGLTWQNNEGDTVAKLPTGMPVRVDSPGIKVVAIPYNSWLINQDAMVVDSQGQPHVVTQISTVVTPLISERNIHYIHYRRSADGQWHQNWVDPIIVPRPSPRPRGALLIDDQDDLHFYTVEAGIFKTWVARAEDDWSAWTGRNLFSGYGGEGFRYDRRLWRNNGVISVPLLATSTQEYQLRTLTLSPPPSDFRLGHFTSPPDLEGWHLAKDLSGEVQDNMLHLEFSGNDPTLRKAGLHLDTSAYSYVKLRLRNASPATKAALFFITKTDRVWNYQKAKIFSIMPDDESLRTYVLDMSDRAGWTGTLVGLRLDPAEEAEVGGSAILNWIDLSGSPNVPSPIEIWRRTHFSDEELENEAISGDLADPVGDGVTNLLNYALGNEPKFPQRGDNLARLELSGAEWVFQFERPAPPEDISYIVESSADLHVWEPLDDHREVMPTGDDRQIVLFRGETEGDARFFRLRITRR